MNPSLHAAMLIRIALAGPRPLFFVWRNVLIAKHAMDIAPSCLVGPGLNLPHPFGLVLGRGVRIGSDVLLYQNVTLGTARRPRGGERLPVPTIGDGVVIHPNCVVAGGVMVGARSVIGANSFVNRDVPADSMFRRGEIELLRPDARTHPRQARGSV